MHIQNPLRSHSHNTAQAYTHIRIAHHITHTQSARGGDRQGECAGSAVSAFSGTSKYPCLDKASDMLRKASRITTVSISPHPSSECHATHPASRSFTLSLSPFPVHLHMQYLKYADSLSVTNSHIEILLCCENANRPITRMWFCIMRARCRLHDSTSHLHI